MKKSYLLLPISLITLSACSRNTTESISSSAVSETTQSSTEQTIRQVTDSEDKFPYAVNISDFNKEITLDDGNVVTTYNQTFGRRSVNLRQIINLNMKDLNEFGKGIYFSQVNELPGSNEAFYPLSISMIPTKTIKVINNDGKLREVKVNTEARIETYEGNQDNIGIIGDTYYLFYNKNSTISLAIRNIDKNPVSEELDTNQMLEYIQQNDGNKLNDPQELKKKKEEYYSIIYDAWKKEKDYIDSIEDSHVKQSVQTSYSAAVATATKLIYDYPEDQDIIEETLQEFLARE